MLIQFVSSLVSEYSLGGGGVGGGVRVWVVVDYLNNKIPSASNKTPNICDVVGVVIL